MFVKKKYFCTREWGFGSNIVNYLKSAMFCHQNNCELILQDRNNVIGNGFCLFSVIELPDFVKRTNVAITFPIEDLKSLVKFNLYGECILKDKFLYSFYYLAGMKSSFFMKNFNKDSSINLFFSDNYLINGEESMMINFKYNTEIKDTFRCFDKEYSILDFVPDLSIQIRGGDKIEELLIQGRNSILVDDYISICLEQLEKINKIDIKVYVMTDTYSYFLAIQKKLKEFYPNADIRSLVNPDQKGYIQANFNNLETEDKINAYYFFLYELEMLRKTSVCIGSFNSNIFYLASLIRYNRTSTFISVDTTFENSFL